MNCKHPTLYVLGPENKPAPYGYCMLCEVARLTADIATLERRERSRNNRIAELEDALPALDTRKDQTTVKCGKCGGTTELAELLDWIDPALRSRRESDEHFGRQPAKSWEKLTAALVELSRLRSELDDANNHLWQARHERDLHKKELAEARRALDNLMAAAWPHFQGMRGDSDEMKALSKAQQALSALSPSRDSVSE